MKQFLIISCFFLLDVHTASANDQTKNLKKCLDDHGLRNKLYVKREIASSKVNRFDEDIDLNKKIACTLACSFRKEHSGNDTLHSIFTEALNIGNFHISEDVKKQMLETLNNCHNTARNDDCQLLHCIQIVESQFMDVAVSITNDRSRKPNLQNAKPMKKPNKIRITAKWFKIIHRMIKSLQKFYSKQKSFR